MNDAWEVEARCDGVGDGKRHNIIITIITITTNTEERKQFRQMIKSSTMEIKNKRIKREYEI